MKMTNQWNRFIYRLWAPIYDATVNRLFLPGRTRALELLELQRGEKVLLAGIGTGADLPLLMEGVRATGIDLSPDMLAKACRKLNRCAAAVHLIRGDVQILPFEESVFDAVILNLILSVVPDGNACLKSVSRALKPGGRAVIFDKFLPEGTHPSFMRRTMNFFSTLFGTDINRRLRDLMKASRWMIVREEPSIGGGMYRVILLKKL